MIPESEHFLLAEFAALRKELDDKMAEVRSLARFAMTITGVIWAWLATHNVNSTFVAVRYLPVVLVALFFLYVLSLRAQIARIGSYIASVEREFRLDSDLGWESNIKHKPSPWIGRWENGFWIILFAVNLLAALLLKLAL